MNEGGETAPEFFFSENKIKFKTLLGGGREGCCDPAGMLRPRGLTRSRCPPEPPAAQGLLPHPDTPLLYFSLPFPRFYFYFFFFFPPPSLQPSPPLCPAPRWGPFPSPIPLLPSLLFAHPSAPSRCLALGKDRPYRRGTSPHPSGCPKFGAPLVTARWVPSLFAAPRTEPHLRNGALGNTDSTSGSLGRLFAPTEGFCRYLGTSLPGLASRPLRMPQGARRVVPIKLFPCGSLHPLLCSWRFLTRLFTAAEAGPPCRTRTQHQLGDEC